MTHKNMTIVSSTQMSIQAKICLRGHVYLYVGHTCLSLRKDEFLDLVQIVQTAEKHLLATSSSPLEEQGH